eukprot:106685-Rhodomonas_salina.1
MHVRKPAERCVGVPGCKSGASDLLFARHVVADAALLHAVPAVDAVCVQPPARTTHASSVLVTAYCARRQIRSRTLHASSVLAIAYCARRQIRPSYPFFSNPSTGSSLVQPPRVYQYRTRHSTRVGR